jgi:hypothetical protein
MGQKALFATEPVMAARIADKQHSIDGTIRATETDTKSALDDVVTRIEAGRFQ